MGYYRDLRDYIRTLESQGKLVRVKTRVNKDTELMPMVRLQFRGLPESQRRAFLFDNMVDSRGREFRTPVVVSALAASRDIYSIGMMCKPEEISDRLVQAQAKPFPPVIVGKGPVQEEVHIGDGLLEHGALDEFPIPISTPGFDISPYITAPFWVSKDPDTGVRNVGAYRAQVKSPTRTGIDYMVKGRGGFIHWRKCKKRGIPLQAAIVIGGPPSVGYAAVTSLPTDFDELAFAGGIAGEPLELVKCQTIDIEVPAHAEIVIEGEISTAELEPEGSFGEAIGNMCITQSRPFFTVKCITHRRNPFWLAMISQYPPSESSKIRQISREAQMFRHLRHDLGLEHVTAVACHETVGSNRLWVVKLAKAEQDEVWKALEGISKKHGFAKIVVAVDDDVDHHDLDGVLWAICHRSQPHRDYRIDKFTATALVDVSLLPGDRLAQMREEASPEMPETSRLLINATMQWDYPPVSLPRKQFMERAMELWAAEGLPALNLNVPWHGVDLGYWSDEERENANRAITGRYYESGKNQEKRRKPA